MPLYLIARLGGETVALDAAAVGAVVEVDRIVPVPRAGTHIAGLCALRSRVLTVIDGRAALDLGLVDRELPIAVVCDVDGHGYALLLDAVDDVVEAPRPDPCPASLEPALAPGVARGLVRIDGGVVLLIDHAALIATPEAGGGLNGVLTAS